MSLPVEGNTNPRRLRSPAADVRRKPLTALAQNGHAKVGRSKVARAANGRGSKRAVEEASGIEIRRQGAREASNNRYLARRQVILDAATRVFRSEGFSIPSMRDIADAAGINRASIYYYFSSKDEILEALLDAALPRLSKTIEAISSLKGSPAEKLRFLVLETVSVFHDAPVIYIFFREDAGSSETNRVPNIVELAGQQFDEAFTKVIDEGASRGQFSPHLSARLTALSILGMLNWTYRWFRPEGPVTASEIGNGMADLVLEGLCKHA